MRDYDGADGGSAVDLVLIVDDHPLYSDALASALKMVFPESESVKAGTLAAALSLLERGLKPSLVIFDLKLPDVSGLSGFQRFRAAVPDAPVLVVSALTSPQIVEALMAEGAAGFLPKDASAEILRQALTEIIAGRKFVPARYRGTTPADETVTRAGIHPMLAALTPQQQKIMRLICEGKPNKQIAYELSLAEATVKAHITALLRRLGVRNRTQAAVLVENAQPPASGDEDESDVQSFLNH